MQLCLTVAISLHPLPRGEGGKGEEEEGRMDVDTACDVSRRNKHITAAALTESFRDSRVVL